MRSSAAPVQLNEQDLYTARKGKRAMRYSNHYRHQGGKSRRSSRTDLNPYMIEDPAVTVGELEIARNNVQMVLVSRELRSH